MHTRFNWPFDQTHLSINGPETETYAKWCFQQLSDDAKSVLQSTTWVYYIKANSWLHPGLAQMFAFHIELIVPRMQIAILRGKLAARLPDSGSAQNLANVISAAICELLQTGALSSNEVLGDSVIKNKRKAL